MTQVMQRQESIEVTLRRLETFVHRMELRYECPSDQAAQAVLDGKLRETADVAKWLTSYRSLLRLTGLGTKTP